MDDYLAKAASVTDRGLADGYRELARRQDSAAIKALAASWGKSSSGVDVDKMTVTLLSDAGPLAGIEMVKRRTVAPKVAEYTLGFTNAVLDKLLARFTE